MRVIPIVIIASVLVSACQHEYVPNPDPNHTHADFAVWIDGRHIDFSDEKYMSGNSWNEHSHDENQERNDEYLHLHDGVGHVIHRHKPGIPIRSFFESISFGITADCFLLDTGTRYCENGPKHWRMFINEQEMPFDPDYVFEDMDQILLTYGSDNETIKDQLSMMTDDACIYSKTCPWRGDPPDEGCVADPIIPCVEL